MRAISFKAALVGLTCLSLISAASAQAQASAQAPAPAPAQSPTSTPATAPVANGPLVPGVCLLSQETLIARSKIGQAATGRLREIAQQVQAGLVAEKARLESRGRALEAKRATLTPIQIQAQGQAINQAGQALQTKAGERSSQVEATKNHAYGLVLQQAQPMIAQAYAVHNCGLLFGRETLLFGNFGNDLTPEVLTALDAKGAPVSFDLEPARPMK